MVIENSEGEGGLKSQTFQGKVGSKTENSGKFRGGDGGGLGGFKPKTHPCEVWVLSETTHCVFVCERTKK